MIDFSNYNVVMRRKQINESWLLCNPDISSSVMLQTNHALLEEIKEINRGLIDTVVDISAEDVDPAAASTASEGADGTVVKCSFSAVALGPNLKSQYASAQMVHIVS